MRALLLIGAALLTSSSAAAQTRIEAILPVGARVAVQRLGAASGEAAVAGMQLLPGDLIMSPADSVFVELRCSIANDSEERENTYRMGAPLRVLIDVPSDSTCHINMLAGQAEVLAESPTQMTVGGVTLGSSGTQYSVEVRRTADGTLIQCTVFDGEIRAQSSVPRAGAMMVRDRPELRARAGSSLVWPQGESWQLRRNTAEDIQRSAALHARFDLGLAEQRGAAIPNPARAFEQLTTLHAAVLATPADTAKRVQLARRQIEYRLGDQARYNLDRVNLRSDSALRRYYIDPSVLRSRNRLQEPGEAGEAGDAAPGRSSRIDANSPH